MVKLVSKHACVQSLILQLFIASTYVLDKLFVSYTLKLKNHIYLSFYLVFETSYTKYKLK